MKINTSSIPLGIREYNLVSDAGELELDKRFFGTVQIDVRVEKTEKMVELSAKITAQALLICDRCAEKFSTKLYNSYRTVYLFHGDEVEKEKEEEIVVLSSPHAVIDIRDDVRQYITLAIPLKILCKDDCMGLCVECGKNQNIHKCQCKKTAIDPRWEKLQKLIN